MQRSVKTSKLIYKPLNKSLSKIGSLHLVKCNTSMLFTHDINIVNVITKMGNSANFFSYCKETLQYQLWTFFFPWQHTMRKQLLVKMCLLTEFIMLKSQKHLAPLLINPSLNCCNRYCHIRELLHITAISHWSSNSRMAVFCCYM